MPQVCFYFQLHQPYRLRHFPITELSNSQDYFSHKDKNENAEVFKKVANKCYLPMLSLLKKLVDQVDGFKFALSCSGVFLDQAQEYDSRVLDLLSELSKSKKVEFLAETYYHSLSSLYSSDEFYRQIKLHSKKLKSLFAVEPKVFRNTELIYSNQIAQNIADWGFLGMLTEGVDRCLWGRPLTQVFKSAGEPSIPLLLKHAKLSDDIAFRFSQKSWESYPLTAETYVHWINSYSQDQLINLFMDFETFGEHQWADTGIFDFFESFVHRFVKYDFNRFVIPKEVCQAAELDKLPVYSVNEPISWADVDRDLSAWRDNDLQYDSLEKIYGLESQVLRLGDDELISDWRKLQTSDHFYYMCIKWSADGDVHAYFSPYQSPFEAYQRFSTVLADLQTRIMNKRSSNKR